MKKTIYIFVSIVCFLSANSSELFGQTIYWLESNFNSPRIVKTSYDGQELSSYTLQAGSLPQSIAMDQTGSNIFWTELGFNDADINSISSGFSSQISLIQGQSVLRGIALDFDSSKIYWVSTNLIEGSKILRSDIDGQNIDTLISFGSVNDSPKDISLDLINRKMYWSNFGENKIQRSDMNVGAIPENILTGLNGPSGIVVCADSGKIFWTEFNGGQIKSSGLNGESPTIIHSTLANPNYISVDMSTKRIAWTEIGSGKIKSSDLDGSNIYDYGISAMTPTGILIESSIVSVGNEPKPGLGPDEYFLSQNYPNPFNPSTTIEYGIPEDGFVKLNVFDILGREVAVLVNSEHTKGSYKVQFNAQDFPSGIYIYRLKSKNYQKVQKLVLLK